jgi:hypothetical protein
MPDASQNIPPPDDRHLRMQRVRVGLTGLAIVLLIVVLSTVIFTRFNRQAGLGVTANNSTQANGQNGQTPQEPLAEVGVVPGSDTTNVVKPAPGQPKQ